MPILPPFMPLAFLRAEHIPHFSNWPSTAAPVDDQRDDFRGYFRRASGEVARRFVTHNVTSPPQIDALRKVHSPSMTRCRPAGTAPLLPKVIPV